MQGAGAEVGDASERMVVADGDPARAMRTDGQADLQAGGSIGLVLQHQLHAVVGRRLVLGGEEADAGVGRIAGPGEGRAIDAADLLAGAEAAEAAAWAQVIALDDDVGVAVVGEGVDRGVLDVRADPGGDDLQTRIGPGADHPVLVQADDLVGGEGVGLVLGWTAGDRHAGGLGEGVERQAEGQGRAEGRDEQSGHWGGVLSWNAAVYLAMPAQGEGIR